MRCTIDFIGRNGDWGFGSGDWGKNFFQIFFARATIFACVGVFGTQMLRIRKFGEMPCGYDAALWNFRLLCAATPQRHFAKVMPCDEEGGR